MLQIEASVTPNLKGSTPCIIVHTCQGHEQFPKFCT